VNCSNGFGSGYFRLEPAQNRRESTCHRTPARARALRHHLALSIGSHPQMIAHAFPLTIRLFCLVTESQHSQARMCNLYSLTKGQAAIRDSFRARHDHTGDLPPLPIGPDGADRSQCGSRRTRPRDGPLGMLNWRHNYEAAPEMPGRRSASPGIFANVLVLAKSQC
jgi:hypothetical protein